MFFLKEKQELCYKKYLYKYQFFRYKYFTFVASFVTMNTKVKGYILAAISAEYAITRAMVSLG